MIFTGCLLKSEDLKFDGGTIVVAVIDFHILYGLDKWVF